MSMLPGLSVSIELGLKLSGKSSDDIHTATPILTAKGVKVTVWDTFGRAGSRLVAVCFASLECASEGCSNADLVRTLSGEPRGGGHGGVIQRFDGQGDVVMYVT